MLKSYFTAAWRYLLKNKGYSAINIIGLAAGTAIALLIGLWIWDEVSFDQYHTHYKRLAQVMDVRDIKGEINTDDGIAIPLANVLRSNYGADFKRVAVVFPNWTHTIAFGDKKIAQSGEWVEPDLPEMLTLKMISGKRDALKDPSSVLITQSLARALFGAADPVNKPVRLDNMIALTVGGVFEDLPRNSSFYGTRLFLPWARAFTEMDWLKEAQTSWDIRSMHIFVELNDQADIAKVNAGIKAIVRQHIKEGNEEILLHPMSQWRLYSEFKNGKAVSGRIRLVWLFGSIGAFVLLLACINFMNLSTARSAGRAKEVGIRKAIGSLRGQLIGQFLSESLLIAALACVAAIGLVWISLPLFNKLTQKQIPLPFGLPLFWVLMFGFTLLIGLISGSYPAFYLSAFQPVKVLKGAFRVGRNAAIPRRVLIVVQFTVSILLTIGSIIVYRHTACQRPARWLYPGRTHHDHDEYTRDF
jgi:putative ABC transport system permease protein